MAKLLNWLKSSGGTVADPLEQSRIESLAKTLYLQLKSQWQSFSLAAVLDGHEVKRAELEIAKERVYRVVMQSGWQDGLLDKTEQRSVALVAQKLELPADRVRVINLEFARQHFAAALSRAFEDRTLDAKELAELQAIVASVGMTTAAFMRDFFIREGESFLRAVFLACVEDGVFSADEWQRLIETAGQLGLSQAEMLSSIRPQAQQFVEHVLADAKTDGLLSPTEEGSLNWLVTNLDLTPEFRQYVQSQVWFLKMLTEIARGKLPVVAVPAEIAVRDNETVHLYVPATWRQLKHQVLGTEFLDHQGTLILTNLRMIFVSPTLSQSFSYDQIMSHRGAGNGIEVQIDGRPMSTFLFGGDVPLAYPIFQTAVRLANQTKVVSVEGQAVQPIPREIRQRVWQRYSGRCGECGGSEQLEFDYLIPLAKGGSNSEANLQLICRGCTLAKTDQGL